MTLSDITRIGVLGAGQMGRGIAQVAAASGWDVWLFDTKPAALEAALDRIRQGLNRAVEKGTVKADQRDAILERLRPMNRLRDFDEVPLIIEAVPENATLKCDLFRQLGLLCQPETVLASNTSSISITKLGAASGISRMTSRRMFPWSRATLRGAPWGEVQSICFASWPRPKATARATPLATRAFGEPEVTTTSRPAQSAVANDTPYTPTTGANPASGESTWL